MKKWHIKNSKLVFASGTPQIVKQFCFLSKQTTSLRWSNVFILLSYEIIALSSVFMILIFFDRGTRFTTRRFQPTALRYVIFTEKFRSETKYFELFEKEKLLCRIKLNCTTLSSFIQCFMLGLLQKFSGKKTKCHPMN